MRSCWSPCRSSERKRALALTPVLCLFGLLSSLDASAAGLHVFEKGRPRALAEVPTADDVGDPLLALLIGVLDADAFGTVGRGLLDSVVVAGGGSKLPYEDVKTLAREPAGGGVISEVEILLRRAVDLGVPYSILGYHPGSVRAPKQVLLREWRIPQHDIRWVEDDHSREARFVELRLFSVEKGRIEMDVDWWLDKLLGSKLDDTHLVGFVITEHEGKRYAVAFGYTKDGRGRSGCFDLEADEIIFPAPMEFLHLGREMRARVEELKKGVG
jgi:hypothetical protein